MVTSATDLQPILLELQVFLSAQAALLARIRSEFGLRNATSEELSALPRTGTLHFDSEVWDFKRHGNGILFEERTSHRRVDVYERLDEPEVFDVWRLGTYFRSLGPRGRKVLAKACGMSETAIDDAVVLVTEELLRAGLVGKDGSGFSVLND